jgi:hypothetical protein
VQQKQDYLENNVMSIHTYDSVALLKFMVHSTRRHHYNETGLPTNFTTIAAARPDRSTLSHVPSQKAILPDISGKQHWTQPTQHINDFSSLF